MRLPIIILSLMAAIGLTSRSATFDDRFDGRTLRLDYVLGGDANSTQIYLQDAGIDGEWAGRRHHLDKPYLRGNGRVTLTDRATADTIYTNTFATLFQEWQHTREALTTQRAFQSTFLVPMPRAEVNVTVELLDNRGVTVASMTHPVDPADILLRHIPATQAESRYVHRGGDIDKCVDIAVVAEGYTAEESDKFFGDAGRAAEALLSHEPFASMADRFNILAVMTPSGDSGPDVPREGKWGRTAHRSHYDTFYSDRYLTTRSLHGIHESLAGLPVEHIILMVNTPRYGGGGIFNQITVCTSDHPTFKQVLVHEFGHAYGGLADEYYYADDNDSTYALDAEPWEPNITSLCDFQSKWADLCPANTSVPTPTVDAGNLVELSRSDNPSDRERLRALTQRVGVFEGAGYRDKGLYRPVQECRMKVNEVEWFCPVCSRAIEGITKWYTEE